MTTRKLTLVGDGIENPANALTMLHAAEMFGAGCVFHDRNGLQEAWASTADMAKQRDFLPSTSLEELAEEFAPRLAFDNLEGAADIYGFSLPKGPRPAVVVGNERRGIARAVRSITDTAFQLPMASNKLNCLNVAAAAAVALYYLSRGGGGKMQTRSHPSKRRPELLLLGPADHFELGSSIRSAGALGWGRVFVEDRVNIWFGCDRVRRSEGRAAARRGRNPIRIIPIRSAQRHLFEEVCVVTTRRDGQPLHRTNLARGPRQLLVFPDEDYTNTETENWQRLGQRITHVRLDLPRKEFPYHYRLPVSIALAEAARQIGRPKRPFVGRPKRHEPLFDKALRLVVDERGETVYLADLADY